MRGVDVLGLIYRGRLGVSWVFERGWFQGGVGSVLTEGLK